MSNPTMQVRSTLREFADRVQYWPLDPNLNYTYQTGQMMGLQSNGYAASFDDTQPLVYLGIYKGLHQQVYTGDPPGLAYLARIDKCPFTITLQQLSLTPLGSRFYNTTASGGGVIGKVAYAWDAGSVTVDPSNLTYGNMCGIVEDIQYTSPSLLTGTPANMTSTTVVIEPLLNRHGDKNCGARVMSGSANGQLFFTDIGKVITCAATANLTITLPPAAFASIGDEITILKTNSNSPVGEITIAANGTDQVNGGGSSNLGLSSAYGKLSIQLGTANGWILH